jgi:23S rRNA pseudouridine2605 synthase
MINKSEKDTVKLQKFMADAGIASRRSAEEMIAKGRVTVNGRKATIGDRVSSKDIVALDGVVIAKQIKEHTYIMLNKPRGYITSRKDERGRKTVFDLINIPNVRLHPVGRLDYGSEGLLLLTDDGDFTYKLTHPGFEQDKTYEISVKGKITLEQELRLISPFILDGYKTSPAQVKVLRREEEKSKLIIIIHEGRNRQVRRMCEEAGLEITRLRRIGEGGLRIGKLAPGEWRYLTAAEIHMFKGNKS